MKFNLVAGVLAMSVAISGCQPTSVELTIPIQFSYAGSPLECGSNIEIDGDVWQVDTAQIFVSDLAFTANGKAIPALQKETAYQAKDTALIGFDSASCDEANTQLFVELEGDTQEAMQLSFNIGVPIESNHTNPLLEPSPLNDSRMFWSWQMGHKFARFDFTSGDDYWSFHLGDTGCEADSPMRPPVHPCLHNNRINIDIAEYKMGETLVLPLEHLTGPLIVNDGQFGATDTCMSEQQTTACQLLFNAMNEDWVVVQ